jgi:hypothetical protein
MTMIEPDHPPLPEALRALTRDYRAIQAPPFLAARVLAEARGRARRRHPLAWGTAIAVAVLVTVMVLPLLRAPVAPEPGLPGFAALNSADNWLAHNRPGGAPDLDALSEAAAISSLADLPDLSV